jgi:hypothetical protein
MAPKFTPVWGGKAPKAAPKPTARAAAAAAPTDAESGTDAADDLRRSLQALDVMRQRGLIPEAEYEARRRDLLGAG